MSIAASAFTLGLDSASAGSSYSYTASGLTAGAKAVLFFVWGCKSGSNRNVSGLTVGGVPAIKVVGHSAEVRSENPVAVYYTDQISGTSAGTVQVTFNGSMDGCVMGHVELTGGAGAPYDRTLLVSAGAVSGVTSNAFAAATSADSLSFCIYANNKNGAGPYAPTFTADHGSPTSLASASATVADLEYGAAYNSDAAATTFTATTSAGSATHQIFTFQWDAVATVPIVDGIAINDAFSLTNSGTVALTTSKPGDAIVVIIGHEGGSGGTLPRTVSSVTASGLTFTQRGGASAQQSGRPNDRMEVWWAPAAAALSAETITVTLSGNIDNASIIAFGVAGLDDYTNPWDVNGALPVFTTSNVNATPPTVPTITTTNAADFLLSASLVIDGGNDAATSTWGRIADADNAGGALFWSFLSVWGKDAQTTQAASAAAQTGSVSFVAVRYADALKGTTASAGGSSWVPKIIGPF